MAESSAVPTPPRPSWRDAFSAYPAAAGVSAERKRERLAVLDDALFAHWALGANVVILWSSVGRTLSLLVFPHYALAEYVAGVRPLEGGHDPACYIDALASGSKHAESGQFEHIARTLGLAPVRITLAFDPVTELGPELVEALVRRYSVCRYDNRAVVLLDIVAFSTHCPIDQVTLLNSLSYSVNSAIDKLTRQRSAAAQFARSPTGDGFYIWNHDAGVHANMDLYQLMLLLLADNAIARGKARTSCVPGLRAAFHVGAHYEFFQPEGLSPSLTSYLVGQVTIDLARMLDRALPGQILIGDFPGVGRDDAQGLSAAQFVARMQEEVNTLTGFRLAGDEVREIRCYLTGPPLPDGTFGVSRYRVYDKHGIARAVYNAKINIHRRDAAPIFLGVRNQDLAGVMAQDRGT